MKENEFLSIAQEMKRTNDYINKRVYFYNGLSQQPILKDGQLPLVSYQILLAWSIFGENLWGARLINVFFGIASIILLYFIAKLLFDRKELALFCAMLLSIIPLAVFFSRNIQAESPALFFLFLGTFFYLRFVKTLKKYNVFLGGFFFVISWLYSYNFIFGVIASFFVLPYKYIFRLKNRFIFLLTSLLPYLFIFGYLFWLKKNNQFTFDYSFLKFSFLKSTHWNEYGKTIIWYTKNENFTFIYAFLALCGFALAFFKKKDLASRYIIGSVIGISLYGISFSEIIYQNNFIQMPFLGAVCIAATEAFEFISSEIKKIFKKNLFICFAVALIIISLPSVLSTILRMHKTVFFGADVAGSTLKELTEENERFFLFTHPQGNAIARYAYRYAGWPANLEEFKKYEELYKIRFICIYPGEYYDVLEKNYPSIAEYIKNNYFVKEIGLVENLNRVSYYILQKGYDPKKSITEYFNKTFSGSIKPKAIYKISNNYIFFYTMQP
ncbi:MAG: glycosyltransferase family 39 protein [Candidatus Omnitrophica bacterium]|nr:glycosyltransferase family 39 protein [Candidatus Omnitrophota bacterium]